MDQIGIIAGMGFHRQLSISEAMVKAALFILHFQQDKVSGPAGGTLIIRLV